MRRLAFSRRRHRNTPLVPLPRFVPAGGAAVRRGGVTWAGRRGVRARGRPGPQLPGGRLPGLGAHGLCGSGKGVAACGRDAGPGGAEGEGSPRPRHLPPPRPAPPPPQVRVGTWKGRVTWWEGGRRAPRPEGGDERGGVSADRPQVRPPGGGARGPSGAGAAAAASPVPARPRASGAAGTWRGFRGRREARRRTGVSVSAAGLCCLLPFLK